MSLSLSKLRAASIVAAAVLSLSFAAQPTRAAGKADFAGTWQGSISNLPFELKIWEARGAWNATITFQGQPENLEVLGWKEGAEIFYFFRPSDVACISMFKAGGVMNLAYFEKDAVRKVALKKKP